MWFLWSQSPCFWWNSSSFFIDTVLVPLCIVNTRMQTPLCSRDRGYDYTVGHKIAPHHQIFESDQLSASTISLYQFRVDWFLLQGFLRTSSLRVHPRKMSREETRKKNCPTKVQIQFFKFLPTRLIWHVHIMIETLYSDVIQDLILEWNGVCVRRVQTYSVFVRENSVLVRR